MSEAPSAGRIPTPSGVHVWRIALLAIGVSGCCAGSGTVTPPIIAPPPLPLGVQGDAPTVGTPVLAAWQAGQFWFVGVVVGTEGPNLRILYADGTSEVLPAASVTADRMGPGIAVDAHQIGETEFHTATLTERIGHAARVTYSDGRDMWTSVGLVRIQSTTPPVGADIPPATIAPLGQPGSQVLARYTDGYLYSAVVIDRSATGATRVIYADGEGQEVTPDRIQPDTLGVGAQVEVRDRVAQSVLAGTIVQRVEHAVEVRVSDGSTRWFALADARMGPPLP